MAKSLDPYSVGRQPARANTRVVEGRSAEIIAEGVNDLAATLEQIGQPSHSASGQTAPKAPFTRHTA